MPDPDAPKHRITLDPASINREASLREIVEGHWAAVYVTLTSPQVSSSLKSDVCNLILQSR